MRARRFRPICDRLDSRLLLDGSGNTMTLADGTTIDLVAEVTAALADADAPLPGDGTTDGGTDVTSNTPPNGDGTIYATSPAQQ